MLEQHGDWNTWGRTRGGSSANEASVTGLHCPFPRFLNPNVQKAQRWSVAWARQFGLLSDEVEYQHLSSSKIGWLVGRSFHVATAEALQITADWTTLFCLLDDRVEKTSNPLSLAVLLAGLSDVFTSRRAPQAEEPMECALDDLRQRMLDRTDPAWVGGFGHILGDLFNAFTWESINRGHGLKPDVCSYCKMRRITVGLYPQFYFAPLTNGVHLPSKIRRHPLLRRFERAAANCVGWANDVFTYEKEREVGEFHNLVFRLQDQDSLPLDVALERAIAMHNAEVALFESLETNLSIFGQWEDDVGQYVSLLRAWISGHLSWAIETGRYHQPTAQWDERATIEVRADPVATEESSASLAQLAAG